MATSEVDLIVQKAQKLSAVEILNLIQKLTINARLKIQAKDVRKKKSEQREGVYFGKYANYPGPETTEEDFKAVEYHFNEDEWK
ncbi:MAG: hypothetical protein LH614_09980 [Pyrinomonadaceae bacterium]|nr:hypothetical protein [Pyrinomonadaceae bacterium]